MLVRLRNYLKRPVAWGSVLLSYIGIIAVAALGAHGLGQEQDRADMAIIRAAEVVIRDGCDFDNKRAGELRGILERSLLTQRIALKSGQSVLPPILARRNIEETKVSINSISLRNCDLAVAEFRATTKEK